MDSTTDARTRLKALRDRLAVEAPRARIRAGVPPELVRRLTDVLVRVNCAYLATVGQSAAPAGTEEAVEDSLVEAHLVLHELEHKEAQTAEASAKARASGPERRVHERFDTDVTVQLLRHSVKNDGSVGVVLTAETAKRPARNISLGGIFVALPRDELPQVGVGGVVHVAVSLTETQSFKSRAVIMRRDASGIGLSWIDETGRVRKEVEALLATIRRAR